MIIQVKLFKYDVTNNIDFLFFVFIKGRGGSPYKNDLRTRNMNHSILGTANNILLEN